MAPAPRVSLFLFADEPLEEVVQEPFGKVDCQYQYQSSIQDQKRKQKTHSARRLAQYWSAAYGLVEVRVHPRTAPYRRRAPICVVVVVIISVFINGAETVPCIIGKGKNLDN